MRFFTVYLSELTNEVEFCRILDRVTLVQAYGFKIDHGLFFTTPVHEDVNDSLRQNINKLINK